MNSLTKAWSIDNYSHLQMLLILVSREAILASGYSTTNFRTECLLANKVGKYSPDQLSGVIKIVLQKTFPKKSIYLHLAI